MRSNLVSKGSKYLLTPASSKDYYKGGSPGCQWRNPEIIKKINILVILIKNISHIHFTNNENCVRLIL